MSETRKPLEIVDEAFTVPSLCGMDKLCVRWNERDGLYLDNDRDGTVAIVEAADVPRFIDALARLTGNGPILLQVADFIKRARREALEDAAREVDCGCSCSADVLAAKTKADRWRACGEACCGALMARDIRALAREG